MSKSKRDDFTDSQIMDALDACNYNVRLASDRLGIMPNTLYRWIKNSKNLTKYIADRLGFDAVRARDKLNEILDKADPMDTKYTNNVISICKILLDKSEADANKQEINMKQEMVLDKDLEAKINAFIEHTKKKGR